MADIVLKDRDGNPITYPGVNAVQVVTKEGEALIFAPSETGGDSEIDSLLDGTITEIESGVSLLKKGVFYQNTIAVCAVRLPAATEIETMGFYASGITSINAPNVKTAGDSCFYNCKNLVEVNLPSLTILHSSAFRGCSSLQNIAPFENGVSTNQYLFYGCTSLKKIEFKGYCSFNRCKMAFKNCSSLEAIIMRGNSSIWDISYPYTTIESDTNHVFYGAPNVYFYIPSALYENYTAKTNWATYATSDRIRFIEDYPDICG